MRPRLPPACRQARAANPPLGLATALQPLGVRIIPEPATGSGPDTDRLHQQGIPAIDVRNVHNLYLRWHHSDDDTLDKIVPADLNQNVATWALVLRSLAQDDTPLRPRP